MCICVRSKDAQKQLARTSLNANTVNVCHFTLLLQSALGPHHIRVVSPDITQDKTRKMTKTVEQIKKLMGSPRNYGK